MRSNAFSRAEAPSIRTTTRVRVEMPPRPEEKEEEARSPLLATIPPLSHGRLHGDHEPHGPSSHVSVHGPASQYLMTRSLGHAHFGQDKGDVMTRERCVVPTRQLAEHAAQRPHGCTEQSKDMTELLRAAEGDVCPPGAGKCTAQSTLTIRPNIKR